MDFEDRMPHKIAPRLPWEHSITPSTGSEGSSSVRESGTKEALANRHGEYRLIFRGMRVPGFPESLDIGGVQVVQTKGPIWTQRTDIRQGPGWRPVYDKEMRRFPVGDGVDLTVCILRVRLIEDLSSADLERWHAEADAAAGIVAAILDERVAQEKIGEDLIVLKASGAPETAVDHAVRVREFPPTNRMSGDLRRGARRLAGIDLSRPSASHAAFRWYLRAAQEGPTPDAIVALWIALEVLAKPAYGTKLSSSLRRRGDVEWVENAAREAGANPDQLVPSIGRLAGLRAEIVHGGIERPKLLGEGFYALEALTRRLIRHHLGVSSGWPLRPDQPALRGPLGLLASFARKRYRKTRWAPAA